MRIVIVPLLWLGCAVAQLQNLPIGFIDFYGLNGLDAKQLRSALTVHPGDKLNWPGTRDHLIKELTKTAGRPVTHFAPVCCDKNGRVMLYIGFASGSAAVVMRAKSTNHLTLPPQLTELYDQFMLVLPEALKSAPGVPEDYSRGYSLSSHPPMRAIQMRMRETALAHEEELLRVLVEAVDDKQRIVASHLAGYTNHSPRQIAALVEASRDSNGTVRNNATRALAVLAATPKFARGIPAEAFIDHLNSPVWSDRNKGLMLLTSLTRDRNPKVLADLRTRSLPALIEMAHWQNPGHSGGAIRLLGRMAAMDESVLDKLAEAGDPEPVIAAINRPDQKTALENPHTP
jgi:hypothetical protein